MAEPDAVAALEHEVLPGQQLALLLEHRFGRGRAVKEKEIEDRLGRDRRFDRGVAADAGSGRAEHDAVFAQRRVIHRPDTETIDRQQPAAGIVVENDAGEMTLQTLQAVGAETSERLGQRGGGSDRR